MEELIDDPARRQYMGQAAAAFAAALSWEHVRSSLVRIYREIGAAPVRPTDLVTIDGA